jgi:DNA-binding transcriptional regulator of glucitol operon
MAKWQIALALLVVAAALHVIGVLRQIRHYRQVFGELSARWQGAKIGTGAAGGRFAASAMAIVVADDQDIVRAARLRLGAGSFARFLPREDFVGLNLAELRARATAPGSGADVAEAITQAIDAIEGKRGSAALPPSSP